MYDATHIKILKWHDAVRKRPQMYIGDTGDGSGLHTMVYEVVENALEDVLAGFTTEVSVTLNADASATVRDDGRGIPIEIDPEAGISAAEVVMTQLSARGMPGDDGGLFSLNGLAVVNALSARLDLTIWRSGQEHRVRFGNGVAEAPLAAVGPAQGRHGTAITFWPSPDVFHTVTRFDSATLEYRLRELAFLNPGLRVVLQNDREAGSKPQVMHYPNGLSDFVRYLDRARTPLLDAPIVIAGWEDGIGVEAALWWNNGASDQVACYTDGLPRPEGGSHWDRLLATVGRVIARYAQEHGNPGSPKMPIVGEDAHSGLTAVVALRRYAYWTPLSEEALDEMMAVVESVVADRLSAWLDKHPRQAQAILGHARKAASGRAVSGFAQRLPSGRL